jgi:hypothetical protein
MAPRSMRLSRKLSNFRRSLDGWPKIYFFDIQVCVYIFICMYRLVVSLLLPTCLFRLICVNFLLSLNLLLLMSPLQEHSFLRTGHNPTRGPRPDGVLTTASTATNGLTCLPKHGGARDNTFLVTHPMADQCCLASAIVHRGHRAPQ